MIATAPQRVYDYLAAQDPRRSSARPLQGSDQSKTEGELAKAPARATHRVLDAERQLDRFYAEMEHIAASLSTVGAQLVSMSAAGEGEPASASSPGRCATCANRSTRCPTG